MIKRILTAAFLLAGLQAEAKTIDVPVIGMGEFQGTIMGEVGTMGLQWKVGESADYKMEAGFMSGTVVMSVREETTQGFWMVQNMDLGFMGKQVVEAHIDKNTGKVLELVVNGKKENPQPPGQMEEEEMREERITVTAGTFPCIYLRIKDVDKDETSEVWLNPLVVPMAGIIKQVSPGPMGEVTLELTGFNKL